MPDLHYNVPAMLEPLKTDTQTKAPLVRLTTRRGMIEALV